MKKVCTLIMLIALSFNEISCTNQNANNAQSDFSLVAKKMSFTKDDFGPQYFSFEYLGSITNQTKNIYKTAKIIMTLNFQLENGDILTDVDMAFSKDTFGANEAFDMIEMFQPGQVYDMQDLKTANISNDYTKYPIKSVTADFSIELVDEINQTNSEVKVKEIDITDEWKKVINGNVARDFDQAGRDSINKVMEKNEN